jgi:hypothetical protein
MVGKRQLLLVALVGLWVSGVALGMRSLQAYGTGAGTSGSFALRYPQDSQIRVAESDRPSLLIFLHPECPCSRASLEELDRVLARASVKPAVYAVFVVPKGWSTPRAKSALWLRASRMTGVTPVLDRDGVEARRFGAATSGQVYAYTATGALAFSGGITPGRGHNGDNPGRDQLEKYLADPGRASTVAKWKVFGCALFSATMGEACRDHSHHEQAHDHAAGKAG